MENKGIFAVIETLMAIGRRNVGRSTHIYIVIQGRNLLQLPPRKRIRKSL
jgi:hypothetical protein